MMTPGTGTLLGVIISARAPIEQINNIFALDLHVGEDPLAVEGLINIRAVAEAQLNEALFLLHHHIRQLDSVRQEEVSYNTEWSPDEDSNDGYCLT